MTSTEKDTLIGLINGLTEKEGQTQYDDGVKVLKGYKLELVIDFIKKM